MTDLLISIIISGFAITFALEFLYLVTLGILPKEKLYAVLTLPLSFGAMFVFTDIDSSYFVSVPATAFIALMLNKYLNTPTVVNTRLTRI